MQSWHITKCSRFETQLRFDYLVGMSKRFYERLLRSGPSSSATPYHSAFGADILKKFGWTEGNGLGKDEAGPTSCLIVEKRPVGLGLGAKSNGDANENWTNWWEDLYNDVAAKIQVDCDAASSASSDATQESEQIANCAAVLKTTCNNKQPVAKTERAKKGKLKRSQNLYPSSATPLSSESTSKETSLTVESDTSASVCKRKTRKRQKEKLLAESKWMEFDSACHSTAETNGCVCVAEVK